MDNITVIMQNITWVVVLVSNVIGWIRIIFMIGGYLQKIASSEKEIENLKNHYSAIEKQLSAMKDTLSSEISEMKIQIAKIETLIKKYNDNGRHHKKYKVSD